MMKKNFKFPLAALKLDSMTNSKAEMFAPCQAQSVKHQFDKKKK